MYIPSLSGIIDRRMLVNFSADPEVVRRLIPAPFRPQVYNGHAVVGICLIRLKDIRPKGLPSFLGMSSENGAHRFAVEWEDGGEIEYPFEHLYQICSESLSQFLHPLNFDNYDLY